MPRSNKGIDRRGMMKYSTLASAGLLGSFAGCTDMGGGGSGGGGSKDFTKKAKKIGFADDWQKRRMTSLDEWKIGDRKAVPSEKKLTNKQAWKDSKSLKSSPFKLPDGWKDVVGDVSELQILNFGSLKYDPATVATYALFEDRSGITLNPLEIVVDQAIPKETAFLQAGKGKPEMFDVVITDSLSSFVSGNNLESLDALMPKEEMWEPYQPVMKSSLKYKDHLYAGPTYLEASLIHVRPDLLKKQGVPEKSRKAILDGTWTWDDLEAAMKAFEGTGTYAWAYRGSSRVYTMRDFMKMFYQAGGQFMDDSGTVTVNSKPAQVALEKMVEWRDKGWVPDEVVNYGQGDLADGFLSGQFAMVPVYGDLVPKAMAKFKKDGQYTPTLSPKGGKDAPNPTRAGIASPTGLGINVNAPTKKKLAAMLYLDTRLSLTSQWWEFVVEGNQSYSKDVYTEAAKTNSANYAEIRGEQMKLNKAEVFPQERPIKQHVSQECQKALAGDVSPKKALDNAQDYVDKVLGQ
ncbi:extracellular solute-binding protein [Haladaptatus sp. DYF46]|uniref:ABC transporter substrate-binding protein n=1 Tax=Haladaptatus sp. DYF46 TaxID=2886041 RepID=UPI001E389957|nr:extracellular solute-binding protein [Haladaptatus sp. DYF46]